MKASPVIDCCAATILSSFGGTSTAMDSNDYIPSIIKSFLINQENIQKRKGLAFCMIILNEEQLVKMRPILEELEWELVMDKAFHPNHMTKISMFIKKLNEEHYLNRI